MTAFGILDLPPELLVNILRCLDCRDILRCCLICRVFNEIIGGHLELQYIIELCADGMIDDPTSTFSTAERVDTLLSRREAWARLRVTQETVLPISGFSAAYDLVDGVFAKVVNFAGTSHFMASWLPSRSEPQTRRKLTHTVLRCVPKDFAFDLGQDLLVFVEPHNGGNPAAVSLHLRTFSCNTAHPAAAVPVLHGSGIYPIIPISTTIVDNVIGAYLYSAGPLLMIWNWKTGSKILEHDAHNLPPATHDFSFLSNSAYMLTCTTTPGEISLPTFDPESPRAGSTHSVSLLLPELNHDISIWMRNLSTITGAYSTGTSLGKPFVTSPDSRIHVMFAEYNVTLEDLTVTNRTYRIVLHNRTLLSYASKMSNCGAVLPWHAWGPTNACFLDDGRSFTWRRHVHGQRVILRNDLPTGRFQLQVLDFNVHPSRVDPRLDTISGSDLITSGPKILAGDLFSEDVNTFLPYRRSRCMTELDGHGYRGFMTDDERLLVLDTDPFVEEDKGEMHVFTF